MYGMEALLFGIISYLWFYINKEMCEEELDPWEWSIEEPAQSSNALENASKKDIVESMDN